MAKGICVNCGKKVGTFLAPPGYACPGCGKLYCKDCVPTVGSLFKKPVCPTCGRELVK